MERTKVSVIWTYEMVDELERGDGRVNDELTRRDVAADGARVEFHVPLNGPWDSQRCKAAGTQFHRECEPTEGVVAAETTSGTRSLVAVSVRVPATHSRVAIVLAADQGVAIEPTHPCSSTTSANARPHASTDAAVSVARSGTGTIRLELARYRHPAQTRVEVCSHRSDDGQDLYRPRRRPFQRARRFSRSRSGVVSQVSMSDRVRLTSRPAD